MKRYVLYAAACALTLAACSDRSDEAGSAASVDLAENGSVDSATTIEGTEDGSEIAPIPAAIPKIAYDYGLAFELPAADVGTLMRRHASLCEQQGTQSCRIVGMDLSGDIEDADVSGTLTLMVASNQARAVGALLEKEAGEIDAKQTAATIASEEVSKKLVDTEARIRAREELRDRLMAVLRTRQGKISDLVEAERQVAAVNEEIDQARSWLADTRGRVAFSKLDVRYASAGGIGSGFLAPVEAALGSLGSVFGFVLAALLLAGAAVLPVVGLVLGGRALNRRFAARASGPATADGS